MRMFSAGPSSPAWIVRLAVAGGFAGTGANCVVNVALDRIGADRHEQVAVVDRPGELGHLHGVGRSGRLVEVEDHPR